MPEVRGLSEGRCGLTAVLAAALVQLGMAAGCGPGPRMGPFRGFVSSVEDLTLSVAARVRPIKTLYDPDAVLGYSGPLKGIIRAASARAKLFLSERRLFRAEVSHSLAPKLARLVLNGDGFLFVTWPDKKAFVGELETLLDAKLPDVGLAPEHFVIRKLFFPDLEPVSGETPVLVYGKDTYTVEFWTQARSWPARTVTLDDWSHAPTRTVFYTEDGRTAADIRWQKFELVELHVALNDEDTAGEHECVLAKEVVVRLPLAGRKVRFTLNDPRYNVTIRTGRAFRLRVPPGLEVKEIGPEDPQHEEPCAPERAGRARGGVPGAQGRPDTANAGSRVTSASRGHPARD